MQTKQIQLNNIEQKLHDRAVKTAKFHKWSESELVAIFEEVDRLRLFEKFEETSAYHYCIHNLKLTRAVSYSIQAVARKSRAVPELLLAMQEGISLSTANKLVSQITPENQAMWIAKTKTLPQPDLEFELRIANPKKSQSTKRTRGCRSTF